MNQVEEPALEKNDGWRFSEFRDAVSLDNTPEYESI